jgi:hypothetical protein
VASAFPPTTRRPGLPWATYLILRFHPERHDLIDRAASAGWDQARLQQELSARFPTHHRSPPDPARIGLATWTAYRTRPSADPRPVGRVLLPAVADRSHHQEVSVVPLILGASGLRSTSAADSRAESP